MKTGKQHLIYLTCPTYLSYLTKEDVTRADALAIAQRLNLVCQNTRVRGENN